VKRRSNLISKKWEEELYKYITGIIIDKNQKLMIINGMPDHLHILIGLKSDCKISDLVRDIKSNSSRCINERSLVKGRFEWQTGYSAFSVGYLNLPVVINYIEGQKRNHSQKSFRDEYIDFLEENKIEYQDEYLFDFF
jgi:REP element-mobilizing transposase RayT